MELSPFRLYYSKCFILVYTPLLFQNYFILFYYFCQICLLPGGASGIKVLRNPYYVVNEYKIQRINKLLIPLKRMMEG